MLSYDDDNDDDDKIIEKITKSKKKDLMFMFLYKKLQYEVHSFTPYHANFYPQGVNLPLVENPCFKPSQKKIKMIPGSKKYFVVKVTRVLLFAGTLPPFQRLCPAFFCATK